MSQSNHAGNIIVNLANLPDFLRKPILKKRMGEFFTLSDVDRLEIINNALDAGPTIPFPNFAKLFVTWLEIIASISEEERTILCSAYISEILKNPKKIILFNLDGILEIFRSLEPDHGKTISGSLNNIIARLSEEQKRRLRLIIPQSAKSELNI